MMQLSAWARHRSPMWIKLIGCNWFGIHVADIDKKVSWLLFQLVKMGRWAMGAGVIWEGEDGCFYLSCYEFDCFEVNHVSYRFQRTAPTVVAGQTNRKLMFLPRESCVLFILQNYTKTGSNNNNLFACICIDLSYFSCESHFSCALV